MGQLGFHPLAKTYQNTNHLSEKELHLEGSREEEVALGLPLKKGATRFSDVREDYTRKGDWIANPMKKGTIMLIVSLKLLLMEKETPREEEL